MWVLNFSDTICWRNYSFSHCVFWALLPKISWLYMHRFISGIWILFHWSMCLFLCHTIKTYSLITVPLKSDIVVSPALFFFLRITFAIWSVLWFQKHFAVVVRSLNCVQPFATHELQHARLSCPSPSLGVYSNSCPLSQWCHPTISSSATPVSSCPQSFPASGYFPMSHLFTSGGQSIEV